MFVSLILLTCSSVALLCLPAPATTFVVRPDGRATVFQPDGADIQRTTPATQADVAVTAHAGRTVGPAVFTGRPDGRAALTRLMRNTEMHR